MPLAFDVFSPASCAAFALLPCFGGQTSERDFEASLVTLWGI